MFNHFLCDSKIRRGERQIAYLQSIGRKKAMTYKAEVLEELRHMIFPFVE